MTNRDLIELLQEDYHRYGIREVSVDDEYMCTVVDLFNNKDVCLIKI